MSLALRHLTNQRKKASRRHKNKSMPLFLLLNYRYCKWKTSSASNNIVKFSWIKLALQDRRKCAYFLRLQTRFALICNYRWAHEYEAAFGCLLGHMAWGTSVSTWKTAPSLLDPSSLCPAGRGNWWFHQLGCLPALQLAENQSSFLSDLLSLPSKQVGTHILLLDSPFAWSLWC